MIMASHGDTIGQHAPDDGDAIDPPKKPKRTMAEMREAALGGYAADDGGVFSGIPCPRCGCQMSKVVSTKRIGTRVRRKRKCLHCEFYPIETREFRVDAGPSATSEVNPDGN